MSSVREKGKQEEVIRLLDGAGASDITLLAQRGQIYRDRLIDALEDYRYKNSRFPALRIDVYLLGH